jgi:hypothetical protein
LSSGAGEEVDLAAEYFKPTGSYAEDQLVEPASDVDEQIDPAAEDGSPAASSARPADDLSPVVQAQASAAVDGLVDELNAAREAQLQPEISRVECITDERVGKGGKVEFLVRWADYGPSDDSWEPKGNIDTNCPQAVQAWQLEKAGRKEEENLEPPPDTPSRMADPQLKVVDPGALEAEVKRRGLVRRDNSHTSRHKGVCWHKGNKAWSVQLEHGGQKEFLGNDANEVEAKARYDARCLELDREPDGGQLSTFRGVT